MHGWGGWGTTVRITLNARCDCILRHGLHQCLRQVQETPHPCQSSCPRPAVWPHSQMYCATCGHDGVALDSCPAVQNLQQPIRVPQQCLNRVPSSHRDHNRCRLQSDAAALLSLPLLAVCERCSIGPEQQPSCTGVHLVRRSSMSPPRPPRSLHQVLDYLLLPCLVV